MFVFLFLLLIIERDVGCDEIGKVTTKHESVIFHIIKGLFKSFILYKLFIQYIVRSKKGEVEFLV